VLAWLKDEERRKKKLDDSPFLVTCRSGTLAILSSYRSFVHFQCGRHFFSGPFLHMAYYCTPWLLQVTKSWVASKDDFMILLISM